MENQNNQIKNDKTTVRTPMLLAVAAVVGMMLGAAVFGGKGLNDTGRSASKYREILNLIDNNYVDTVNTDDLVDFSIKKMLEKLDPHTSYFNVKDAVGARAQLESGYDGIGIEFNLFKDTVQVVTALSGGPSEKVGIQSGDKIVRVDGANFTGKTVDYPFIYSKLRGKRGSEVKIEVLRRGKVLPFVVTRDRIPSFSIDATYMIDRQVGFIKVNRFSESTYNEFKNAVNTLKSQGMTKLLLDLRGNPGGFMDRATNMVDELLGGDKMIVYTDGKDDRYDRQTKTSFAGSFEQGAVIVLIDEGSASASEIVSGALQDHDRALVVGRRSFGKGLVQMPINLSDGSELRLTISRYYIPSGRSIQKPYDHSGTEEYEKDLKKRYDSGEFFVEDSIKNNPKMKFKTASGRVVYGGGGIRPDVFVPRDTSQMSNYVYDLFAKNILRTYALSYTNENRKALEKMPFNEFLNKFSLNDAELQNIVKAATAEGIKMNEKEYSRSKSYIRLLTKAYIARNVYQKVNNGLNNEYYQIMAANDNIFQKALTLFDRAEALAKAK